MIPLIFYFMCTVIRLCDLKETGDEKLNYGNLDKEEMMKFREAMKNGEPMTYSKSPFATIEGLVPSPENDPPKKYCGYKLINAIRDHCWPRATYSSSWNQQNMRPQQNDTALFMRKRNYNLCKIHEITHPNAPVTQCCCKGCTKFYMEAFCEYPDENTPRKYLDNKVIVHRPLETSKEDTQKMDLSSMFPPSENLEELAKFYQAESLF